MKHNLIPHTTMIKRLSVIVLMISIVSACKTTEINRDSNPNPIDAKKDSLKKSEAVWKARSVQESVFAFMNHPFIQKEYLGLIRNIKPTGILVDTSSKTIDIQFNTAFSYIPFREENTAEFYKVMQSLLPDKLKDYTLTLYSLKVPIQELIPNFYRTVTPIDSTRLAVKDTIAAPKPIVREANPQFDYSAGLTNHPIAMWHSHGWYYNPKEDRWMWQRARLFGTVEDLYPASIVIPYLTPMLENAGAPVFLPRERDFQTNEIIVDNNGSDDKSIYREVGAWKNGSEKGFSIGKRPYKNKTNPFRTGSFRESRTDSRGRSQIGWIPEIPEDGDYAVYISYNASEENTDEASYTVHYSGGSKEFLVNQKIGGSTWIYLGTFHFKKGIDSKDQKVVLSSKSSVEGDRISADAVRFGGGMGVIERNGKVSERPKFTEGSRYWLQYAGFPDSLVYSLNINNDYNDDYQSRGEWVNYLTGSPSGPNKDRTAKGLGIPIELSMAFHTDAGVTGNDNTIGTLMIYSIEDSDSARVFPNGQSRFANRDFGDIMQTELVDDIRVKFDSTFRRRNLYNRMYSEAFRQNTPALLLELLSHQNFSDMKHGLDPEYKFEVARSIYKSMAKYIAVQHGKDYVIQPLPVSHFSIQLNEMGQFDLKWKPVIDSLEATAVPEGYIVYIKENDEGFDTGRFVKDPEFIFEKPKTGIVYSFKVEAVNKGGKSMPSEILSAGLSGKGKAPVMVVNAFTRISGPSFVSSGNFEGFTYFNDRGVPDKYDISFVGDQYNFDKSSRWVTDDEPGHGASYANYETSLIAGNTFDYPAIHGQSILNAGYSFVSSSVAAVMDNYVDITYYKYVDMILGEQKATSRTRSGYDELFGRKFQAFPERLRYRLNFYVQTGGNLFISGANVTTDNYKNPGADSALVELSESILQVKHRTDHASVNGEVVSVADSVIKLPKEFRFNTFLSKDIYQVESADGLEPSSKNGRIVARYKENNISAISSFEGYYKTLIFGFPFETILGEKDRDAVMKAVLQFFDKPRN